ncbi:DUF6221 family protein [Streptomyces sp. NK08204]|uniref:DUF6221 family protein n=1 Tax=Streptomyces sp. NK08204 TaxID=2873260 RepID=UPI001CED647E|nr:DUF6221 family protein [Streptomyces sp. NK08204]
MDELVRWLDEQLTADTARAQACPGNGKWDTEGIAFYAPDLSPQVREHIVEHDPARVLREIDASRDLLGRYKAMAAGVLVMTGVESILSEYRRVILPNLALRYADRPGYREEWRP